MRRRHALFLLLALLAPAMAATAALAADKRPAPAPLPVGVRATVTAAYRRVEVVPAGRLLGVVLPLGPGAKRRVVLLTAPADGNGPRSVWALDLEEPALHALAENLPAGIDAIDAIDLDGDGIQEVLLGQPGQLYVLRDGAAHALAAPGWFDLLAPWPRRMRAPGGRPLLVTAEAGRLRCFAPAAGSSAGAATLQRVCDEPLPLTAERETRGLFLRTPQVNAIERPAGAPLLAVGPETLDKRRLRSLVIDPEAPGKTLEAWSRLPGPEQVQDSWYFLLGGQPALAVATVSADKLSLFEHQKLRVFRLTADRTRAGHGPLLTFETESPRWHALGIVVRDLDGDGNEDLALIGPKGLDGKPILAQAFLGDAAGNLKAAGGPSKLDLHDVLWSYGGDVTGDGRPDLVAAGGGTLQVFAGQVPAKDGPLSESPWRTIPLAVGERAGVEVSVGTSGMHARAERFGWSTPLVVDLDGRDGKKGGERGAIFLLLIERDGPGALEVITWR